MEELIIPVDKQVSDFIRHIEANPRTILSSKFGDGKSFFLKSVLASQTSKDFKFLTIYPVNYQIASNEDIFRFIKHDIFFQLMLNDILPESFTLPDNRISFLFFIQNKFRSFAADIIPFLSELGLPQEQASKVLMLVKGHSLFTNIKKKYDEFKQSLSKDTCIDDFMSSVESNFVYEEDLITTIIKESINKYKTEHSQKIALVIEDLDRIDPAHLFRILNVFSAHMDSCYKCAVSPDSSLVGNKFGLDNVVLVADFANIRKIFRHFYGEDTDFTGYISKFLSSHPFRYSLKESRREYLYNHIHEITGCPTDIIRGLIGDDYMDTPTIRDFIHSFTIDKQIAVQPIFKLEKGNIALDTTVLKVFAIMRRLGFADEAIIQTGEKYFKENLAPFYKYIAPYKLFLIEDKSMLSFNNLQITIQQYRNSNPIGTYVQVKQDGTGQVISSYYSDSVEESKTDFMKIIRHMLEFIAK